MEKLWDDDTRGVLYCRLFADRRCTEVVNLVKSSKVAFTISCSQISTVVYDHARVRKASPITGEGIEMRGLEIARLTISGKLHCCEMQC